MKILCVCTGNVCRSPMMEYLLRNELEKQHLNELTVTSAGTETLDDYPPTDNALIAMQEIGVDISAHRSRRLTQKIADTTDIFVAMTTEHGVRLAFHFGVDPEKILIPGSGIPDPYGSDVSVYRKCRDQMIAAIPQLIGDVKDLCS